MSLNIDWISIYQDRPGYGGVVGEFLVSKVRIGGKMKLDPWGKKDLFVSNQVIFEKIVGERITGSYDSSLMVTSTGNSIRVSGNPSKFNRLDNVFGYQNIQEAVSLVYNPVLVALGLPPFDLDHRNSDLWRGFFDGLEWAGARLSRVDLTKNFALGEADAVMPFLQFLGTRDDRMKVHLFPDGRTVEWGGKAASGGRGTKYVYRKVYDKAFELDREMTRLYKKGNVKIGEKDWTYLDRLLSWLHAKGVVRFEVELKSRYLTQKGMDKPWIADRLKESAYAHYADRVLDMNGVEVGQMDDIFGKLVGMESERRGETVVLVSQRYAWMLKGVYNDWLRGVEIREQMSKAAFYKARKILKSAVGIDIGKPSDVIVFPQKVRVFTLTELEPPSFYRHIDFQQVNE